MAFITINYPLDTNGTNQFRWTVEHAMGLITLMDLHLSHQIRILREQAD